MPPKKAEPGGTAELRGRAEAQARNMESASMSALTPEESRRLVHELQVHQIELEMQNEELRSAQAEIEAGRDRYFDLYDLAPVGYCTLSEDGLILQANLTAATLLGTTRGALIKQPIAHFIFKADRDLDYLHRMRLFEAHSTGSTPSAGSPQAGSQSTRSVQAGQAGEPQKCELRMIKPDGTFIWAHLTATVAPAGDGATVCRVALTDITDRKQAEEAQRESLQRLEFALQGGNLGMWDWNPQNGAVIYNNLWAQMLEYGPDEIEPTVEFFKQHVHPEDLATVLDRLTGHVEGRLPVYESEHRFRTKHGRWMWVLDRGKIAERDKDGRPLRVTGIITDITDRKAHEEHLKQFEQIVSSTSDGISFLDKNYRYVIVNKAYEAFSGRRQEDLIGLTVSEYLGEAIFNEHIKPNFDRCLNGELVTYELWFDYPTVGRRYIEVSYYPYVDAMGDISGVVANTRDMTEHKRAEDEREKLQTQLLQAQKMESVGRLAGGVAHDFNNLLMGIMNYVDLCRDGVEADHPIREWLDAITREAERSATLTRQLLAFARKQTVAPRVLDLNDTVVNLLNMLRRLIGEDIDLSWQPGAALWSVKLDPGQLDQILVNLCVNARDAIDGAGKITIETENVSIDAGYCAQHAEAAPGAYVTLAVSDDGCGMDRETAAHVFEPFFTTKGIEKGSGLGLATVYGIVKQNNGFVNVYSEPGVGTSFRIYLPRVEDATVEAAEPATQTGHEGGTETILLVEDEPSIRVTTGIYLEQLGYRVVSAESPAEALQKVAAFDGRPDMLITDVVMPGMNGRELARHLNETYPGLKVLYMSGYTANVILHQGVLEEGVEFLSKPVGRDVMARKIREVLAS